MNAKKEKVAPTPEKEEEQKKESKQKVAPTPKKESEKESEQKVAPSSISESEIENEFVDLSEYQFTDTSFEQALIDKFGSSSTRIIKKVSYNISKVGLSIEESCLLAGLDYKRFMSYVEQDDLLKRLLLVKTLEYKQKIMKTLSKKAAEGDYKTATWLAEKKYQDEYGKGSGDKSDDDLLSEALDFVRQNSNPADLIKDDSAGTNVVVSQKGPAGNVDISNYLK